MIRINLIIVRIPKDHLLIQRQTLALFGAIILAVAFSGWWVSHASSRTEALTAQLEAEKAKLARLELVAKRIEEFEKKKQRREQILEAIKKLEAKKVGPRMFLDDLNTLLPPDIWLTKIDESAASIVVSGYSFSNSAIADLMRVMEASPNFADIELSEITNEVMKGEDVKKFTLNCSWETLQKLEEEQPDKAAKADTKPGAKKPGAGNK